MRELKARLMAASLLAIVAGAGLALPAMTRARTHDQYARHRPRRTAAPAPSDAMRAEIAAHNEVVERRRVEKLARKLAR